MILDRQERIAQITADTDRQLAVTELLPPGARAQRSRSEERLGRHPVERDAKKEKNKGKLKDWPVRNDCVRTPANSAHIAYYLFKASFMRKDAGTGKV